MGVSRCSGGLAVRLQFNHSYIPSQCANKKVLQSSNGLCWLSRLSLVLFPFLPSTKFSCPARPPLKPCGPPLRNRKKRCRFPCLSRRGDGDVDCSHPFHVVPARAGIPYFRGSRSVHAARRTVGRLFACSTFFCIFI